jgi:hypothetical protein
VEALLFGAQHRETGAPRIWELTQATVRKRASRKNADYENIRANCNYSGARSRLKRGFSTASTSVLCCARPHLPRVKLEHAVRVQIEP